MTHFLAEIVSNEPGTADVLFLIAVVLAVLSAIATSVTSGTRAAAPLLSLAVAAVALSWLVL